MASKLFNLIIGGTSIGASTYFTTWLLTGENPAVCTSFILLYGHKINNSISRRNLFGQTGIDIVSVFITTTRPM